MYGISEFDKDVRPILSLYTRLSHVHKTEAGEGIGYSQTYHSGTPEWIGTVPIGYADGWIRANQGRVCYIQDQECEFVGRICMDQCMVDVTDLPVAVGDKVTLFGADPEDIRDLARRAGTIPYEVLCLISARVPRLYL